MEYENNWDEEQVCDSIQDYYLDLIWGVAHEDKPEALKELKELISSGNYAITTLCRYIVQQEQELDRRLAVNNDILESFGDKIQEVRKAYHQ